MVGGNLTGFAKTYIEAIKHFHITQKLKTVTNTGRPSKKSAGILKRYSKTSGITAEFWWNSTGIPAEYCRRYCPNLRHVFQNYSDERPLIFWRKEPEFLWNFVVF